MAFWQGHVTNPGLCCNLSGPEQRRTSFRTSFAAPVAKGIDSNLAHLGRGRPLLIPVVLAVCSSKSSQQFVLQVSVPSIDKDLLCASIERLWHFQILVGVSTLQGWCRQSSAAPPIKRIGGNFARFGRGRPLLIESCCSSSLFQQKARGSSPCNFLYTQRGQ